MILQTIKEWPHDIYHVGAVIVAVKDELDKVEVSHETIDKAKSVVLMECLAELWVSTLLRGFYFVSYSPQIHIQSSTRESITLLPQTQTSECL